MLQRLIKKIQAYIIDKLKLEITYEIIKEVIWGDKDWYHSNNGYWTK